MLHYPCEDVAKHSSWRDSCLGPCESSEPPHKEGRTKYTAGMTIREFQWLPEKEFGKVQSHGEKQLSVLPWTPSGQGTFKHRPPSTQTHFSTHSISTQFNLLTTGCLPDMVQFGDAAYVLVEGGRQKQMNTSSIQYVRCWEVRWRKLRMERGLRSTGKGHIFKMTSRGRPPWDDIGAKL